MLLDLLISHTGTQYMDLVEIFNTPLDLCTIYVAQFSGCRASFVYSSHPILECHNLFSGVKFGITSILFISLKSNANHVLPKDVREVAFLAQTDASGQSLAFAALILFLQLPWL